MGRSKGERFIAIPYEEGKPVSNSRFGHELVEINCTIQMYEERIAKRYRAYVLAIQSHKEKIAILCDAETARMISSATPEEGASIFITWLLNHPAKEEEARRSLQLPQDTSILSTLLQQCFTDLNQSARQEMSIDTLLQLEETTAVKDLQSIFGKKRANQLIVLPPEVASTMAFISLMANPDQLYPFLHHFILKKIARHATYSYASPQLYGALTSVIYALSGTLWNKATYPVEKAITSPESIGKTISILSREPIQSVVILPSRSIEGLFSHNCGIIDLGGTLKDVDSKAVALKILSESDTSTYDGIIFYDTNSMPMVMQRDMTTISLESCHIKPERLLAYWAQAYTTGSDLKISPRASCLVTINKDTILRDLVQAVWRLRKLGEQHVQFALNEATKSIIYKKLQLDPSTTLETRHVIAFVLSNQIDRQAMDNNRALQQKADAILQKAFLRFLLENSPSDLDEALEACKDLFIQTTSLDPSVRYGHTEQFIAAKERFSQLCTMTRNSSAFQYLTKKGVVRPEEVEEELRNLSQMLVMLPEKVPAQSSNIGVSVQVSTQTQTQTQTQTAMELQQKPIPQERIIDLKETFKLIWTYKCELEKKRQKNVDISQILFTVSMADDQERKVHLCMSLKNLLGIDKRTDRFAILIPDHVGASINLCQAVTSEFSLFTRHYQPMLEAVYVQENEAPVLIAINQDDASSFPQKELQCKTALVNIHSGEAYPDQGQLAKPACDKKEISHNFTVLQQRVALKIFSGNLRLVNEEPLSFLAACIQAGNNGFTLMREYLEQFICSVHTVHPDGRAFLIQLLEDKGEKYLSSTLSHMETIAQHRGKQEIVEEIRTLTDNLSIPPTIQFLKELMTLRQKLFETR